MPDLNVANIQHFSVGDGPGIRSTVFLKGCNLHCPWCHNPETISPVPQLLVYKAAGKKIAYGENMAVNMVLENVLQDIDFYKASGGGVTVSGGEPLLQAEAVAELCNKLQQRGIHTLLDTAGNVPQKNLEMVLPYTDCFFFDWKTPDPQVCAQVIGGDFDRIFENLRLLLASDKEVHVRMPLIPSVNDRPEDLQKSADKLRKIGAIQVDILPFHRLGSGKYEAMGLPYAYADVLPPSDEQVEKAAAFYRQYFSVYVEK